MATPAATLLEAAKAGDVALVVRCLEQTRGAAHVDVNCVDGKGYSPLSLAARAGHVGVVETLVGAGAAIDHANNYGNTALITASYYNHARVVKVLVAAGVNVNCFKPSGETALTLASDKGHVGVVEALVGAGAAIDHANNYGSTALISASNYNHARVVKVLVAAGANVNCVKPNGATALMLASANGHVDVVEALVGAGAAIDHIANNYGSTALINASYYNHARVVKLLLEAGADVTIQSTDGTTARSVALMNGFHEIVDMLTNYDGSATAAFAAISRNDFEAFTILVDKHTNARGSHDRTLLHAAASRSRLDMVQLLVDRGVNVNSRDTDDWSALHHASQVGHVAIVKLLLARGCRSDITATDGQSPVMIGAAHGHVAIVRELHNHGANLHCIDNGGRTLLHHAARLEKSATVVEYLLTHSKEAIDATNAQDQTQSSPLHYASRAGNADTVTMLVSHGATVNAQDGDGETALVIASATGNATVVTTLLTHGARTDLVATAGQTALSVVVSAEIRSVLQLYHNSQQFHDRCAKFLSAVDAKATEVELMELVPLITSAYDLRLFMSVVSRTCDGEIEIDTATRAALLSAALSHVATSKLVYDDHACVFFKLVLKHCETNAWLPPRELLWLDRLAEKVNNENADWVLDLQKKIHNHSWRLDAHEQSLRCVVDGVKQVHAMVLENRQTIKAMRARIGHAQLQLDMGKKLMRQLITHGNQLSDHVNKLQKRLMESESNLIAVAEGLHAFRGAHVARLGQEAKTRKIKMIGGLVASVAGFVFAPVLKEAFDAVVDLTNPIEIFGLAYCETDIVKFLAESTTEHALEPLVENQMEKLMIPKDEFETLLREEIAVQHPELLDECAKRGLLTLDFGDLVVSGKTEYVRMLEPSLTSEASVVDALLSELQAIVMAKESVATPLAQPTILPVYTEKKAVTQKPVDNQAEEHQVNIETTINTTTTRPELANSKTPKPTNQSTEKSPEHTISSGEGAVATNLTVNSSLTTTNAAQIISHVVFVDDVDAFPYHVAVFESHGQLASYCELVDVLASASDRSLATMAMQISSTKTSRESLSAAEYAHVLGYRDVGDYFATRLQPSNNEEAESTATTTAFIQTPAKSVKLLEASDEYAYICIVEETQGDIYECELLCNVVREEDHAMDARIQAEVVRESTETVSWSAVEYASHLGCVEIVKHLLKEKCRSMPTKTKIQVLRHAQQQQALMQ